MSARPPTEAELLAALQLLLRARAPEPADDWIDCSSLPVSAKALRRAVSSGELRASRVGRALLAKRSEVDAWLERRRVKVTRSDEAEPSPALRLLGAKSR